MTTRKFGFRKYASVGGLDRPDLETVPAVVDEQEKAIEQLKSALNKIKELRSKDDPKFAADLQVEREKIKSMFSVSPPPFGTIIATPYTVRRRAVSDNVLVKIVEEFDTKSPVMLINDLGDGCAEKERLLGLGLSNYYVPRAEPKSLIRHCSNSINWKHAVDVDKLMSGLEAAAKQTDEKSERACLLKESKTSANNFGKLPNFRRKKSVRCQTAKSPQNQVDGRSCRYADESGENVVGSFWALSGRWIQTAIKFLTMLMVLLLVFGSVYHLMATNSNTSVPSPSTKNMSRQLRNLGGGDSNSANYSIMFTKFAEIGVLATDEEIFGDINSMRNKIVSKLHGSSYSIGHSTEQIRSYLYNFYMNVPFLTIQSEVGDAFDAAIEAIQLGESRQSVARKTLRSVDAQPISIDLYEEAGIDAHNHADITKPLKPCLSFNTHFRSDSSKWISDPFLSKLRVGIENNFVVQTTRHSSRFAIKCTPVDKATIGLHLAVLAYENLVKVQQEATTTANVPLPANQQHASVTNHQPDLIQKMVELPNYDCPTSSEEWNAFTTNSVLLSFGRNFKKHVHCTNSLEQLESELFTGLRYVVSKSFGKDTEIISSKSLFDRIRWMDTNEKFSTQGVVCNPSELENLKNSKISEWIHKLQIVELETNSPKWASYNVALEKIFNKLKPLEERQRVFSDVNFVLSQFLFSVNMGQWFKNEVIAAKSLYEKLQIVAQAQGNALPQNSPQQARLPSSSTSEFDSIKRELNRRQPFYDLPEHSSRWEQCKTELYSFIACHNAKKGEIGELADFRNDIDFWKLRLICSNKMEEGRGTPTTAVSETSLFNKLESLQSGWKTSRGRGFECNTQTVSQQTQPLTTITTSTALAPATTAQPNLQADDNIIENESNEDEEDDNEQEGNQDEDENEDENEGHAVFRNADLIRFTELQANELRAGVNKRDVEQKCRDALERHMPLNYTRLLEQYNTFVARGTARFDNARFRQFIFGQFLNDASDLREPDRQLILFHICKVYTVYSVKSRGGKSSLYTRTDTHEKVRNAFNDMIRQHATAEFEMDDPSDPENAIELSLTSVITPDLLNACQSRRQLLERKGLIDFEAIKTMTSADIAVLKPHFLVNRFNGTYGLLVHTCRIYFVKRTDGNFHSTNAHDRFKTEIGRIEAAERNRPQRAQFIANGFRVQDFFIRTEEMVAECNTRVQDLIGAEDPVEYYRNLAANVSNADLQEHFIQDLIFLSNPNERVLTHTCLSRSIASNGAENSLRTAAKQLSGQERVTNADDQMACRDWRPIPAIRAQCRKALDDLIADRTIATLPETNQIDFEALIGQFDRGRGMNREQMKKLFLGVVDNRNPACRLNIFTCRGHGIAVGASIGTDKITRSLNALLPKLKQEYRWSQIDSELAKLPADASDGQIAQAQWKVVKQILFGHEDVLINSNLTDKIMEMHFEDLKLFFLREPIHINGLLKDTDIICLNTRHVRAGSNGFDSTKAKRVLRVCIGTGSTDEYLESYRQLQRSHSAGTSVETMIRAQLENVIKDYGIFGELEVKTVGDHLNVQQLETLQKFINETCNTKNCVRRFYLVDPIPNQQNSARERPCILDGQFIKIFDNSTGYFRKFNAKCHLIRRIKSNLKILRVASLPTNEISLHKLQNVQTNSDGDAFADYFNYFSRGNLLSGRSKIYKDALENPAAEWPGQQERTEIEENWGCTEPTEDSTNMLYGLVNASCWSPTTHRLDRNQIAKCFNYFGRGKPERPLKHCRTTFSKEEKDRTEREKWVASSLENDGKIFAVIFAEYEQEVCIVNAEASVICTFGIINLKNMVQGSFKFFPADWTLEKAHKLGTQYLSKPIRYIELERQNGQCKKTLKTFD